MDVCLKHFLNDSVMPEVLINKLFQNISDMVAIERPDWQAVMAYVTSIYKHFELDQKS